MLFRRLVVRFWADSSSLRVSRSSSSRESALPRRIWMRPEETSCIVSHLWWVKEHWGINQSDNEAEGANDAQLLCRSSPEDDDWGRKTLASELIKCAKCSWRFLLFNSSATLTYFALFNFCIVLSAFRHYVQLPVTLSLDFLALSLWAQFILLLLYFWPGWFMHAEKLWKTWFFHSRKKLLFLPDQRASSSLLIKLKAEKTLDRGENDLCELMWMAGGEKQAQTLPRD